MSRKDPRPLFIGGGHPNLIKEALEELSKEEGFNVDFHPAHLVSDWQPINCLIQGKDFEGYVDLQQMPGCCAILTASYIRYHPQTQEGFEKIVHIIEDAAYNSGFGSMVLTQVVPAFIRSLWRKEPWFGLLDKKWVPSDPFINAKSGNLVVYLTHDLKQNPKRLEAER